MPPKPITEHALAKVNLTLHVTGQRQDGYHLLDSLVVFAGVGDVLHAVPANELSLTLEGPFGSEVPADSDNLVLQAARALGGDPVAFTLIKKLPPASGIGGGSADAAAAIRALLRLRMNDAGIAINVLVQDAAAISALGADVPVCLLSQPARMRGVGEVLDPLRVPACWMVLANPRVEVPTPAVFRALARKENAAMPDDLPVWPDAGALAQWLTAQRNDLQAPAIVIAPVIGRVIGALERTGGALIARMSGSGATCYALFASEAEARAACESLAAAYPEWWVEAAFVAPGRAPPCVN